MNDPCTCDAQPVAYLLLDGDWLPAASLETGEGVTLESLAELYKLTGATEWRIGCPVCGRIYTSSATVTPLDG